MIVYVVSGALFIAAAVLFTMAGDIFLSFIGNEIHIGISYKNHSGFMSCFVTRRIKLEMPVFVIKDFDLALGAEKALIKPDFSEVLDKKTIILKCSIKNAAFLRAEEKFKDTDDLLGLFGGKMPPLLDRLINVLFSDIDGDLRIFGKTLEFRSVRAESRDIKLLASGSVTESGDTKLDLEIFFSSEIVGAFPEELKAMLTAEATGLPDASADASAAGWFSYRIKLESGESKPFLKLETDTLKLEFKQIEGH